MTGIPKRSPNLIMVKEFTRDGPRDRPQPILPIQFVGENPQEPKYATIHSSGFDLCADEEAILLPGETKAIKTGLAFQLPPNTEMTVRPRSGLSVKTKLRVILGTVDADYRGEVCVICENGGKDNIRINKGDRIAQGVLTLVLRPLIMRVQELSQTDRGANGFGSTDAKEKTNG